MHTGFRADRLLPDAHSEFAPGAVVVEGDRIAWVGPASEAPAADRWIDLDDAVLVPGLVNAHGHLDLAHLKGRVPFDGDFTSWIDGVRRGRMGPGQPEASIEAIGASVARGTTCFGDVVTPKNFGFLVHAFGSTGARARLFVEALGFQPELADRVFEQVRGLAEMAELPPRVETGLSPHAPYSVSRPLISRLLALADGQGRPCAIHCAETMEELAFLRHGIGPIRETLRRFGADDPGHVPYGGPREFLETLDLRNANLLLVHGNYLRPRDVPPGSFVIYCPTAHHFFGHPEHAVLELVAEGVRVALGSDSAASGETTDTLSETQFLARARIDVDAKTVFQMATEWGAMALGFDAGRLAPGKLADLAAFRPAAGPEVLGLVDARCVLTVIGGEIAHRADPEGDAVG